MARDRALSVSAIASAAVVMLLSPGMVLAHGAESQAPPVTHGPDPATEPLKRESTALGSAAAEDPHAPGSVWCGSERASDDANNEVTNGDGKFHVIYAHAADQGGRFAQLATYFEEAALESSNVLIRTRGRALRYDLGTDCGPRNLDISAVRLAKTGAELDRDRNGNRTFGLVADELKTRGFDSGAKNYLVFLDAPERHCGEGAGFGDIAAESRTTTRVAPATRSSTGPSTPRSRTAASAEAPLCTSSFTSLASSRRRLRTTTAAVTATTRAKT